MSGSPRASSDVSDDVDHESDTGVTNTPDEIRSSSLIKRPRALDEVSTVDDGRLLESLVARLLQLTKERDNALSENQALIERLGVEKAGLPSKEEEEKRAAAERAVKEERTPLREKVLLDAPRAVCLEMLAKAPSFSVASGSNGDVVIHVKSGEIVEGSPLPPIAKRAKALVKIPSEKDTAIMLYGPHAGARVAVKTIVPSEGSFPERFIAKVLAKHTASVEDGEGMDVWEKERHLTLDMNQLGLPA